MRKSCSNCLYEYFCDWTPAGEKECCEYWKSEDDKPRKENTDEPIHR